jgi:methyl-accepting chemotaxis protein
MPRFSSTARLVQLVALSCLIAVGLTAYFSFTDGRDTMEHASFEKLTALRSAKAHTIETLIDRVRHQAILQAQNEQVGSAFRELAAAYRNAEPLASYAPLERYYADEYAPRVLRQTGEPLGREQVWPQSEQARTLQTRYLAENPHPVGSKHALDAAGTSAYDRAHARFHDDLRAFALAFGYGDLFLIDAQSGDVVYSVHKEADFATNVAEGPYAQSGLGAAWQAARALPEGQARLIDFAAYLPSYGVPAAFMAAPIYQDGAVVGVLALQVTVAEIDAVMTGGRRWAEQGLAGSGETYLVGGDGTMRSESRFLVEDPEGYRQALAASGVPAGVLQRIADRNTGIGLQPVTTEAASAALAGETGTRLGTDYQGNAVLYSFAPLHVADVEWAIVAEMDTDEAVGAMGLVLAAVSGRGALMLLVVIALAWIGTRHYTRELNAIRMSAEQAAAGDYSVRIRTKAKLPPSDPLVRLAQAFNTMTEAAGAALAKAEEQTASAEQEAQTARAERAHSAEQQAYYARSVEDFLERAEALADGDLTVTFASARSDDAIARLAAGLNQAVVQIRAMVEEVGRATQQTASGAQQITHASQALSRAAAEQLARTEEAAQSVTELVGAIGENAESAGRAAQTAHRSREVAADGGRVVGETVETIRSLAAVVSESAESVARLGASGQHIGEIVEAIRDIADQTNLLALNAAIEAARAGDAGRGFAVVADEVRKLAERTTQATQQVEAVIGTIQSDTHLAVRAMERGESEAQAGLELAARTSDVLEQIGRSSDESTQAAEQIAAANEEQSATAADMMRGVEQVGRLAQTSASSASEIAEGAGELAGLTRRLAELMARFQTERSSSAPSAGGDGALREQPQLRLG